MAKMEQSWSHQAVPNQDVGTAGRANMNSQQTIKIKTQRTTTLMRLAGNNNNKRTNLQCKSEQ
jgi:hypothetical protein